MNGRAMGDGVSTPQLDLLPTGEVVALMLAAEQRVIPTVRSAVPAIVRAAELIAERMRRGGRLIMFGAGTSGRLAVLEAAELPGTFGLAPDSVVGCTAGAGPGGLAGTDWDEDNTDAGRRDLAAIGVTAGDVLVAVAASGRTPYTLAAAALAKEVGAAVVAVTTTVCCPLAELAEVNIAVPVGAEVLNGSTRLTAGSAQKIALDALTTAAMVRLGRVHGNTMVDVVAANTKLRERSAGQVADICGCDIAVARTALARCEWNARAAVLHIVADLAPERAVIHAAAHPTLREAITSALAGQVAVAVESP